MRSRNKTLMCFTPDIHHGPPAPFATLHCLGTETFGQGMVYRTLFFLTGPCICFSPLRLPWPFGVTQVASSRVHCNPLISARKEKTDAVA